MANILIEGPLPDLPSASGVEILDTGAYIIGDDLPFLYQFDATTLTITVRIALFDAGTAFASGRWPKLDKLGLECMAALVWLDGRSELLLVTDDDAGGSTAGTVHLGL